MKDSILTRLLLTLGFFAIGFLDTQAQGPKGKSFGIGIILGEPTGISAKYWLSNKNALDFAIGGSYFGAPRLQVDYIWNTDAFSSSVVKVYAGPGLGIGFGRENNGLWLKGSKGTWFYRDNDNVGISLRAIVGVTVVPTNSPLELFLEIGPNIGIVPGFGSAVDAAIGIRYYP